MTPSWCLLHPLSGLLFWSTGIQPSPLYHAEAYGHGEGALCEVWSLCLDASSPASMTWVFATVKKYTATSGMFLLWSLWSLTCTCQACMVFPTDREKQKVSSVIVYPFLVSAASIVLQIPHLHAPALLDTQGMGPIAQVCPASAGKIQGLQTSVEATRR